MGHTSRLRQRRKPDLPPTAETPQGEVCIWCNALICDDPPTSKRIRRRWVAAIAAILGMAVTTATESVVLGETVANIVAGAIE